MRGLTRRQHVEVVADSADHDGVASVVPAGGTCADIGFAAEDIDELAFSFIAPLTSENDGRHDCMWFGRAKGGW